VTTGTTTVRISVADYSADITSNHPTVTTWINRYFGSWWHAAPPPTDPTTATIHLTATVDSDRTHQLADQINQAEHETIQYARQPLHLIRDHNSVRAHDGHVAYHVTPNGPITLTGHHPDPLASAASRLAREALRGRLAAAGWVLLHASAVVDPHGHAWVAFGNKAAGKTSTAIQLAHANNWSLLANDRLFARPTTTGHLQALPWPAAAAIGLGLLTATGHINTIAAARHQLHPSTPTPMLTALATGSHQPQHAHGRELKAQLFPDQFTTLLGIPLATTATITTILLPTINPHAQPTMQPGGRTLTPEHDAFHATIEDRYPPIWGIRHNETPHTQTTLFHHLNQQPRWTLTLNHNTQTNKTTLTNLTTKLNNKPQKHPDLEQTHDQ